MLCKAPSWVDGHAARLVDDNVLAGWVLVDDLDWVDRYWGLVPVDRVPVYEAGVSQVKRRKSGMAVRTGGRRRSGQSWSAWQPAH